MGAAFDDLGYHWVAPATTADGRDAVLKLGPPGDPDLPREARALELFGGRGAVRLLASDPDRGALLLERARPGHPLVRVSLVDDDRATRVAAAVMARLRRPPPRPEQGSLRTVRELAEELGRLGPDPGPLPPDLVEQAARRAEELTAEAEVTVVLHGDLHHGNLLRSKREGWLAVDPKGFVGDPAFEPGALIRNPGARLEALSEVDLRRLVEARVAILADALDLDPGRVLGWTFVQSVLAAAWRVEDHGGGWEPAAGMARVLRALDVPGRGTGG